jgi:hypothetical protein
MITVVNDIALPHCEVVELRILARNVVPGIPYLNLGRTSRLHPPRLEPVIPLRRPLPNPSFTHLGAADS